MDTEVTAAIGVMSAHYVSSHKLHWWGRVADWVGFLLTAAITLIVGGTGQVFQGALPGGAGDLPAGAVPAAAASLGRKWMRAIGVMSALASVMIAVSSRVESAAKEQMDDAEKIREVIKTARTGFLGPGTDALRQQVIDNLKAETAKYQ
jgi:Na+/proline symporter